MKIHFDKTIAESYGIYSAIVLDNILYWVNENKKANKNFYDGKYWTYNSIKELSEHLTFVSPKQIRTALITLRDEGLIEVNNFNKTCSRTLWYTVTEKALNILETNQDEVVQDNFSNSVEEDEELPVENELNSSEDILEDPKKAKRNAPQGNTICPTGQNEMPHRANHPNNIPHIIYSNIQEKEIYKEKESLEQQIFNFWNSKRLLKATEISNYLKAVISNLLKSFTLDDVLLSIARYDEVLNSEHFYDHEFTFKKFLTSSTIKSFLDDGENWANYVKWKNKTKGQTKIDDFIHNRYTAEQIANCIVDLDEVEP